MLLAYLGQLPLTRLKKIQMSHTKYPVVLNVRMLKRCGRKKPSSFMLEYNR